MLRSRLAVICAYCIVASVARAAEPEAFSATVRPFLAKYCVDCHGADDPKGEIDLDALGGRRPLAAGTDVLADAIVELRGYRMPPPRKAQPSEADRANVIRALSQTLDRIEATQPPFAGPAAVRRLNRAEYLNAVSDLLGIDVELSTELPADDTAHGFDNVADGLSLSPLLLEKYLAAAEEVLGRLQVADPSVRPLGFRSQGGTLEGVKPDWRQGDAAELKLEAEATASVEVPATDDYQVRVRAAKTGDRCAEPATLLLKLDGVDVKVWSVYRAGEFVGTVRLPAGRHRLTVRHTWYTSQVEKGTVLPDVRLRVDSMEIRGPLALIAHRRVFGDDDAAQDRPSATRAIERFAGRAFRRPVAAEEAERLAGLYERARKAGRSHAAALNVALASVLVSPHFLFHVVRDASRRDEFGAYWLNDWELANRLSFFLWSAPPDDALREVAAAGRLTADGGELEAQVRRMLADPRAAAALADNFGMQWLGLRKLDAITFDKSQFPQFGPELARAMREEARLFCRTMVEEDRPVREFLSADWTWLNEDLARLYGVKGVKGGPMRRVTLTDASRGGVLTMPGVLAITSHPTRTSAVKRGKWVLDEILGAPPAPPPPNVPVLDEPGGTGPTLSAEASLRQRLERHRADPKCFGCHVQMDALGLGLENFDPLGRWRVKEGGHAIDPSGTLPSGQAFSGPADLRRLIAGRAEEFDRCLTEKMMVYALGRGLVRPDRREVERIARAVSADDHFSTLATQIVLSYPFRYRQAEPEQRQRRQQTTENRNP